MRSGAMSCRRQESVRGGGNYCRDKNVYGKVNGEILPRKFYYETTPARLLLSCNLHCKISYVSHSRITRNYYDTCTCSVHDTQCSFITCLRFPCLLSTAMFLYASLHCESTQNSLLSNTRMSNQIILPLSTGCLTTGSTVCKSEWILMRQEKKLDQYESTLRHFFLDEFHWSNNSIKKILCPADFRVSNW